MSRFIHDVPAEALPGIVAGLMREYVQFVVHPSDDKGKFYTIEMTSVG